MKILEKSTGSVREVEILPVKDDEFKKLSSTRYFFEWSEEQNQEVDKLQIIGSQDVLGLMSIERIPEEWRVHIRLLTVSRENFGRGKQYDGVAGNMLTHAAKIAIREFGEMACISLRPKSQIVQHYISKYHMQITGVTLSLEAPGILELIKKYDHD